MQIKDWVSGMVEMRLLCADPQTVLNDLLNKGIMLKSIRWIDDLTVELTMPQKARKVIEDIKQRHQCEIIFLNNSGLYLCVHRLTGRLVLFLGILSFFLLSLYLQNHILFVEVLGNSIIPEREIIINTENCGLYFGARRRDVRSEQIKNMLLENIPQLQWVGINTAGCVATISVRERTDVNAEIKDEQSPASIVAARDGTICEVTASKGTILCQIGQQVKTGQTLISGTNSCGDIMLMTRAQGEVFAYTERNLVIKTIPATAKRTTIQSSKQQVRIIFGKKLINLFKYSGILDASCVKIGERYNLVLPKGYILPVGLYCERITSYRMASTHWNEEQYKWLLQQGSEYISNQMIAGEIVNAASKIYFDQSLVEYRVKYSCKEMIGQIKKEELFCIYGKNS